MTAFPHSMTLYQSSIMLGISLPKWEAAMGSCFHFELVVRLVAGVSFPAESVTMDVADGKKGPGLLSLLFQHLHFADGEKAFLPRCNTLRNKLIHCEPDAVARIIRELNPAFAPPAAVRQIPLDRNLIDEISGPSQPTTSAPGQSRPATISRQRDSGLAPESSGADILEALTTQKGAIDVRTTTTRSDGFAGWMMQAAGDGTFDNAVALLRRGIEILESKAAHG